MAFVLSFLDLLITILYFAVIARALVSWLPIDRYHPVIRLLDQITEPILAPIRRVVPPVGGMMDLSPIIAMILLMIIQRLIFGLLGPYA